MTTEQIIEGLNDIAPKKPKSEWGRCQREIVNEAIKALQTERKGKWIDIVGGNGKTVLACRCSECGNSPKHALKTSYCPNCGTKMDVVE